MNYFAKNIKFLRLNKDMSQTELASSIGFKQSAWSGYESGASTPNFKDLLKIIEYFDTTASLLLETDLENVALIGKPQIKESSKNVALNVAPNVALSGKKQRYEGEVRISVLAEPDVEYGKKNALIPMTDISVAAGAGHFNTDHIDHVESLRMPVQLLKRNSTYLCVKIKGVSMAPTLQDGGYVIIRLLERSEWHKMPDESVFVVSDMEGKSYLKRVKNRFNKGFIILRSDSPDRASFPNFNLTIDEINTIWYVEWYLSAKMPNIHDQFYGRLQTLEDRVDELANKRP